MRNGRCRMHGGASTGPRTPEVVGPGTTTHTIGDLLDQKKTLLGVDLFQNKKIIASDVNEKQILEATKERAAMIIVTPIGVKASFLVEETSKLAPR